MVEDSYNLLADQNGWKHISTSHTKYNFTCVITHLMSGSYEKFSNDFLYKDFIFEYQPFLLEQLYKKGKMNKDWTNWLNKNPDIMY
jgi:hypothetical protein